MYEPNNLLCPTIHFDINYKGCKIKWIICNTELHDLDEWLNLRKSMLDVTDNKIESPVGFSSGESLSWYCWCKDGLFELHYNISGIGGDSYLTISIQCEEMLDCVNDIIDVLECVSKNIRYIPKQK